MSLRFPKAHRLLKGDQFSRVRAEGRKLQDSTLRIIYLVRTEDEHLPTRLGLAISRRAGNAPQRNRIKRHLRESFRARGELVPEGVDLFVTVKNAREAQNGPTLRRSFTTLLKRLDGRLNRSQQSAGGSR